MTRAAVKALVHTQTIVRGLLREVTKLVSSIEKAEEKLFNTILDNSTNMHAGNTGLLQSLFEEKQSLLSALEGLYAAKYMLESLDSLLESVERPERIPVVLNATLVILEKAGEVLRQGHEAESLYIRIVRAELEGVMEANRLAVDSDATEVQSIVEAIHRGALQQARTSVQTKAPPSPILGLSIHQETVLA